MNKNTFARATLRCIGLLLVTYASWFALEYGCHILYTLAHYISFLGNFSDILVWATLLGLAGIASFFLLLIISGFGIMFRNEWAHRLLTPLLWADAVFCLARTAVQYYCLFFNRFLPIPFKAGCDFEMIIAHLLRWYITAIIELFIIFVLHLQTIKNALKKEHTE